MALSMPKALGIFARRAHGARHHRVHPHDILLRGEIRRRVHDRGDRSERLDPHAVDRCFIDAAMHDRLDLSFRVGADRHRLPRRGAPTIAGEGLRPRHHQPHRPAEHFGGTRRHRAMAERQCLGAEAAANIGRDQPHILERHAEPFGIGARHAVEPLARLPHGELVAFPARDQAMRLHRRLVFARRVVGGADADRGRGERRLGVAPFLGHGVDRDAVAGLAVAEVDDGRGLVIADLDQGRGRDRLLEGLGHDRRDMLAREGDVARQRAIGLVRRRRAEPVRRGPEAA